MLNNAVYFDEVDFVGVRKNSVHSIGHLFPGPGYLEGVAAIPLGVHAHVDRTWAGSTTLLVKAVLQHLQAMIFGFKGDKLYPFQ